MKVCDGSSFHWEVRAKNPSGNIPQVNEQFYSDTRSYEYYAYNARMFVSLAAYRRTILDAESATKGWPLLRPPVMYNPEDRRARQISYQSFYLGPSLYVAPVLDSQIFELKVYLPGERDTWSYIHVWTGQRYLGGQEVTVPTPYGKPAVFLVEGKQVPELDSFLQFVKRENETTLTVD